MTTGQPAGEIKEAPATATAAPAQATGIATDKAANATVTGNTVADAKPITTDPADKGTDAPADAQAVAKPASALDADFDDDGDDEGAETEGTEGDKKPTAAGDFPDDWREKLAAGDDKKLARLKRYKSYADFANAGLAAQDKIRSGEYKAKLADDATPEEKAAWRKENGIPDDPKAYETALPNHKWTDADAPLLDGFKAAAHDADLSQPQVNKVLGYYATLLQDAKVQQEEKLAEIDQSDIATAGDALRAELGGEYRPSMNLVKRLLADQEVFSADVAAAFQTARTPDGHRFINHPEVLRFFMSQARDRYGDASFITGDAKAAMTNIEEQARKVMKEDIEKYYAEGWDKRLAEVLNKKKGRAA